MFWWFLRSVFDALPPRELAITFGVILFACSWVAPRRWVSLRGAGSRVTPVVLAGTAGALSVVAVATASSWWNLQIATADPAGFSGWWSRPAPLVAATVVIVITGLSLGFHRRPSTTFAPRRSWHDFTSPAMIWTLLVIAAVALLTALWHSVIATRAPAAAPLFGNVPDHTDTRIFLDFNNGYGYVAGAGWPNHLATIVAVIVAVIALVLALQADANRPFTADASAPTIRVERQSTAKIIVLIMIGGFLSTLGALWMHIGFTGEIIVGLDSERDIDAQPTTFLATGYADIAAPMNLAGHLIQGAGTALLLRLAVDTLRAWVHRRRSKIAPAVEQHDTVAS